MVAKSQAWICTIINNVAKTRKKVTITKKPNVFRSDPQRHKDGKRQQEAFILCLSCTYALLMGAG
jgi:hypothetical protein